MLHDWSFIDYSLLSAAYYHYCYYYHHRQDKTQNTTENIIKCVHRKEAANNGNSGSYDYIVYL